MYPYLRSLALLCLALCCGLAGRAQDSLRVTLPQADSIFITRNLSLLAAKYDIDIARAQVLQARLYPNPNLQFTGNLYNPELKKAFDVSDATGEYIVGAQQLILLAGKRNKQVRLAETGVALSEDRFYDLLRTLRYTLRSDFYQAYFLQRSIAAYDLQIASLARLDANFAQLLAKGVVTLKDAVRVRSLLYGLRAEQAGLQMQFNDTEAELQVLLQNNRQVFVPVADAGPSGSMLQAYNLQALTDTAYASRSDLRLARNTVRYGQDNYRLQKALATPDLTVGAQFDRRGSFVDNASFFTLAMDLPFFNRNQGSIRAARAGVEQARVLADQQTQVVENDVQHAYVNLRNAEKMLGSVDPSFQQQFDQLLGSVTLNFEKRNISLLDFTDFYESYKQNVLQFNQLRNARMQAAESLNFAIGKVVLNP